MATQEKEQQVTIPDFVSRSDSPRAMVGPCKGCGGVQLFRAHPHAESRDLTIRVSCLDCGKTVQKTLPDTVWLVLVGAKMGMPCPGCGQVHSLEDPKLAPELKEAAEIF